MREICVKYQLYVVLMGSVPSYTSMWLAMFNSFILDGISFFILASVAESVSK